MANKKYIFEDGRLIEVDPQAKVDGVTLLDSNDPTVVEELGKTAKLTAIKHLENLTSMVRDGIEPSSHNLHAARWPWQFDAATDLITNGSNASAFNQQHLALEARLRGRSETALQLAELVMQKSQLFTLIGAAIDGVETAAKDAIEANTNLDTTSAIVANARASLLTELSAIFAASASQPEEKATAHVLGLLPFLAAN